MKSYSEDEQHILMDNGDERAELLETIREIVNEEVERKLVSEAHANNNRPFLKRLLSIFNIKH